MRNYFTYKELSCPCCGVNGFKPKTLARFNKMRELADFGMPMTSGYRCAAYNTACGYTQTHATGQAGDVAVSHKQADRLLELAYIVGFTGKGVKQKGSKRFLHFDDLPEAAGRPRPHIWSY